MNDIPNKNQLLRLIRWEKLEKLTELKTTIYKSINRSILIDDMNETPPRGFQRKNNKNSLYL